MQASCHKKKSKMGVGAGILLHSFYWDWCGGVLRVLRMWKSTFLLMCRFCSFSSLTKSGTLKLLFLKMKPVQQDVLCVNLFGIHWKFCKINDPFKMQIFFLASLDIVRKGSNVLTFNLEPHGGSYWLQNPHSNQYHLSISIPQPISILMPGHGEWGTMLAWVECTV